jgi:hypothetical protein
MVRVLICEGSKCRSACQAFDVAEFLLCVGVGSDTDRFAKYLLYIDCFKVTPSPIHSRGHVADQRHKLFNPMDP